MTAIVILVLPPYKIAMGNTGLVSIGLTIAAILSFLVVGAGGDEVQHYPPERLQVVLVIMSDRTGLVVLGDSVGEGPCEGGHDVVPPVSQVVLIVRMAGG